MHVRARFSNTWIWKDGKFNLQWGVGVPASPITVESFTRDSVIMHRVDPSARNIVQSVPLWITSVPPSQPERKRRALLLTKAPGASHSGGVPVWLSPSTTQTRRRNRHGGVENLSEWSFPGEEVAWDNGESHPIIG
jgi:hypothetical protein